MTRRRVAGVRATFRRGAVIAATFLSTAMLLAGFASAGAATAYGAQTSDHSSPLVVRLTTLTPKAPQRGDTLRVHGTVRNASRHAVFDAEAVLRIGTQIRTRGRLAAYAERGSNSEPPGRLLPRTAAPLRPNRLGPGDGAEFTVTLPMNDDAVQAVLTSGGRHPATAAGVYRLAVEVRGHTGSGAGLRRLGLLRTFLPWDPVGSPDLPHPTKLAWVWPIAGRPHRAVGPDFTDNALAQSMRSGRLSRLVNAASHASSLPRRAARRATPATKGKAAGKAQLPSRPVPVTWLVDPMIVNDAAAMSGGYRVTGEDGKHPEGARAAKHWLAQLAGAVQQETVIALPYADPDVVALDRHHVDSGRVLPDTSDVSLLASVLHDHPRADIAAPPGGLAGRTAIRDVARGDGRAALLSTRTMPLRTDPNYTPSAHIQLPAAGHTIAGVLADARLTRIVGAGASDPAQFRAAEQRFLAETLLITGELPRKQRSVVVAPPRDWSPTEGYADALLTDTGTVPWLTPVSLTDVVHAVPSSVPRYGPRLPRHLRPAPLPSSYLSSVGALRHRLSGLADIIVHPAPGDGQPHSSSGQRIVPALSRALDRTESVHWRGRIEQAVKTRSDVAAAVADARHRVRIASKPDGHYLLSSRNGPIAVSVANGLSQPVNVVVEIDAGTHAAVDGNSRRSMTISAHQVRTVNVRLHAHTSGVFPVMLSLHTRGERSRPIGKPVRIQVRSSSYGTVAIGITAGALALLVAALVVRLTRRMRRHGGAHASARSQRRDRGRVPVTPGSTQAPGGQPGNPR